MKLHTLALLSILGMALTSFGVWSLTSPRNGPIATPEPPTDPEPEGPGPHFVVNGPVSVDGRLGHEVLPADQSATTYLFTEMSAATGRVAKTPAPLNLAIVIDRSGSMRGKRLENAIAAAQGAVSRLRDGDQVSVVTYNTVVEDVVRPTTIDASTRHRVVSAISNISAAGDTCISCGIEAGLSRMRSRTGMVKRILLLSDGEATSGIRDESGFRTLAARCREAGTSVTTIGVDIQYNERIMAVLAAESNGRHHFVRDAAGLPAVFDEELAALNKTIAMDAELVVTPAPGISLVRVYDRTYRLDGSQIVVPLGTFAESEKKTVLVAVRTPPNRAGELDVAKVELRYRDLTANEQQRAAGELALRLSDSPGDTSELDVLVENRLTRSGAGDALEEANALYRAGKREQARARLQAQLDTVAKAETRSKRKATTKSRTAVDNDYKRQREALEDADDAFAEAPANAYGGAAAPAPRPAAQVRTNQERAAEMGY